MPKGGSITPQISSISAAGTPVGFNLTFSGGDNQQAAAPASGKRLRIKFLALELSADAVLAWRFAAAGALNYLRTTKGPWAGNLVGANVEGAADQVFFLNASAACTVKGFLIKEEF